MHITFKARGGGNAPLSLVDCSLVENPAKDCPLYLTAYCAVQCDYNDTPKSSEARHGGPSWAGRIPAV